MTGIDLSAVNWLVEKSLVFVAIMAGFYLLAAVVRHYLPNLAAHFGTRLGRRLDDLNLKELSKIVFAFIIFTGLYLAVVYLPLSQIQQQFATRLFRSIIIVMVAWAAAIFMTTEFLFTKELRRRLQMDNVLVSFFSRIIKFIIISLAVVLVAHEWGYDINGFIAGLGLGGLAIALAAKDALANIFGGVVIIMEKPFSIGDQVQTPTVEGKVEDISFRSTRFRNAEHALVTVPNSTLANEAITNLSRMNKRRIKLSLLLDLPGTRNELENCIVKIRELLTNHPELYPDSISVHLQSIGTNSLEVSVICFTRTINNEEYLAIKEDLNYDILDILRAEKIALAGPGKVTGNDGFKNSTAES